MTKAHEQRITDPINRHVIIDQSARGEFYLRGVEKAARAIAKLRPRVVKQNRKQHRG